MVAFVFALMMPFVAFLMLERWASALAALVLQVTVLGWPIATIWALLAQRADDEAQGRLET